MNLGIAAATPRGLMVPNIKDAQELSLRELAIALNNLTTRAREGKTQPAEMANGTLTITNIGSLGIDTGTPIINPGEVAIVAFGTIKQKPWVVDGEVIPRWVTTLGGSFDHRVVDGDLSARFYGGCCRDSRRTCHASGYVALTSTVTLKGAEGLSSFGALVYSGGL